MPVESFYVCDYCGLREPTFATHMTQVDLVVTQLGATEDSKTHDIGMMCKRCVGVLRETMDDKLAQLNSIKAGE